MLTIPRVLLVTSRCEPSTKWDCELVLPFELRQKSRLRTVVSNGEEIGMFLERGSVLRDGDLLRADDGRVVRVVAKPEPVLDISCDDAEALVRVAYHLGNRHVAAAGRRRVAAHRRRSRAAQMVEGLGATVISHEAPFEPEAGAYARKPPRPGAGHPRRHHSRIRPRGGSLMDAHLADLALARLLRLASPFLPVGAFSYSQGLESCGRAAVGARRSVCPKLDRRSAGAVRWQFRSARLVPALPCVAGE